MRRLRPQIVLSFHRLGVSGHSDHIAVAEFVDRAFVEAVDGPVAYFGFGVSTDRASRYERASLAPIPDDEVAARVSISPQAMERKIAAIRAHETQINFFLALDQKFNFRELTNPECFALPRSRMKPAGRILTDIWDGIDA
jgi:LmbE family N-acetylglucosaminyl deacetylase